MADCKSTAGILEMGLSYASIPGPPLSSLTMGQLLEEAAKKWEDSECLYDAPMNGRFTFGQLKTEADCFATGLLKLGLVKGDRIGIWGPNDHRWIITFLASAKVGIIIVPLNPNYEVPELLYALNHLSVKCLVLAEPVKTRDFSRILSSAIPDMKIMNQSGLHGNSPIISSIVAPHLKIILYMGADHQKLNGARLWADIQGSGKDEDGLDKMRRVAETVQFDDILYVPFTSGTTGRPKGAMISHHAQVNTFFRVGNRWCLAQEDRHCLTLPIFHLYGLIVFMTSLCFGCSVVIPSSTFNPCSAITAIAKEKCTWVHGTSTIHYDLLKVPDFDLFDLSSLKAASIGAASSAKKLLAQIMPKYGISRVTMGYGTTEANSSAFTRFKDPPELLFTAAGFPFENTEVKIIDARVRIVPVGEKGEICCRSFALMQGYWEDPEKTKEVIDSARWYHTGDAGYFLESGHLAVAGRFKDMLIRGGENIYPKEIEDFLYQNLTEEIGEVHVFGVYDERLGEVVAAWILPDRNYSGVSMNADSVRQFCVDKISRRKIPVYIKFLQSKDDFPRTPIGKVQKNVMQQRFEKELGLTRES